MANPGLDWNSRLTMGNEPNLPANQRQQQVQQQQQQRPAPRTYGPGNVQEFESLRQNANANQPSAQNANQAPNSTLELYRKQIEARQGQKASKFEFSGSRTTTPATPPAASAPPPPVVQAVPEYKPSPVAATTTGGEGKAADATGMASLDVELPERGTCYLFATPGGDLTLSARSIPQELLGRGLVLGLLLALVIVLTIGGWLSRRLWRRRPIGPVLFGLLVAFGCFLMLLGLGIPGAFTLGVTVCLIAAAGWVRRTRDTEAGGKPD